MVHLLIGRRRDTKNPTSRRVSKIGLKRKLYRARQSEAPKREAFFITAKVHEFVIIDEMMRGSGSAVNGWGLSHHENRDRCTPRGGKLAELQRKKSRARKSPA
jgi:hypothetical protein